MFDLHALRRIAGAILLIAFASFMGAAAHAAGPTGVRPVALTDASVKAFIASYPTVKGDADTIGKKYNVHASSNDPSSRWGAWMKATAAWGEMDAAVKPFGFDGFQSWLNTTISVATAYTFAAHGGEMSAGMSKAVDSINKNPNLTAAQKKMMLQQMQSSMGSMSAMGPPQGNIDAVTPYLDQLGTLFKH